MNSKHRFVVKILDIIQKLAVIISEIAALTKTYTDRGYAPGGANPLTEADITTILTMGGLQMELDLAKFNEIAGMLTQFQNFMTGLTATKADHSAVVNKYRQDV